MTLLKRIFLFVSFAVLVSFGSTGCVTQMQSRLESLPKGARVGILLIDSHGVATESNIAQSFVFNALIEHGLTPVALNTLELTDVVRKESLLRVTATETITTARAEAPAPKPIGAPEPSAKGPLESPAKAEPDQAAIISNPAVLRALQGDLQRLKTDYVIVLHARASGLDSTLQAVVIRVSDLAVVGSKIYRKRVNGALCGGLTAVALSPFICPWLFVGDNDAQTYRLVQDLVALMTGR